MIFPHILIALACGVIGAVFALKLGMAGWQVALFYSLSGGLGLLMSGGAVAVGRVSRVMRKPSGQG